MEGTEDELINFIDKSEKNIQNFNEEIAFPRSVNNVNRFRDGTTI